MSTVHDLGGAQGFGPVAAEPEREEPVFHAPWERSVAAMMMLLLRHGRWSLDRFRKMIESQPPLDYLRHTYYENWLAALERLVVDSGMVSPAELAAGRATPADADGTPATAPPVWSPRFEAGGTPRFGPGERVRSINRHPTAHTRQPRYVRGREGTVVRHVGAEPLPEAAAELVCQPEHLYLVRFEAEALWGADAKGRDALYIELWERQLEPLP